MKGFGLVEVGPDVEDDVPGEFQDLEEHDDGDPGEETQSSSKRRNEVIGLFEIQIVALLKLHSLSLNPAKIYLFHLPIYKHLFC